MGTMLESRLVAFLAAGEGTEQAELQQPWEAVLAQGGLPVLVSPAEGKIQMFEHLDRGDTMPVDLQPADTKAQDYAGLVLPGGVANPDQLRTDPAAVAFVRSFFDVGLPVAAICHAPWTLIEADVVRGHRFTSWPSLWTDLRLEGAEAVDEELVIDGQFTSSRSPADLPAFCPAIVAQFAKASVPG